MQAPSVYIVTSSIDVIVRRNRCSVLGCVRILFDGAGRSTQATWPAGNAALETFAKPSFPQKRESRGGAAGWREMLHFHDLALHGELRKGLLCGSTAWVRHYYSFSGNGLGMDFRRRRGGRHEPARSWRPPRHSGLSPRVRGNPHHGAAKLVRHRSIPACAGEPPPRRGQAGTSPVYPRVCGGTSSINNREAYGSGLSPRVRGNLRFALALTTNLRSIPACAGEPPRRRSRHNPDSVYPRVCGGTSCPL